MIATMPTRVCSRCGTEKSLSDFERNPKKPNGRGYRCNRCVADLAKERYYANIEVARKRLRDEMAAWPPEKIREHRRRYRRESYAEKKRKHPGKMPAWIALSQAVRSGRLIKPASCQRCGKAGRTEGHHHDYSKPLVVEWVCRRCHGFIHRIENGPAYLPPDTP